MPLMVFHDIELPKKFFGFGSSFGPQHDTIISTNRRGFETRVGNWRHARRTFDVWNKVIQDVSFLELQRFVLNREGSLHSFKITDLIDFTTAIDHISAHTSSDVRIGTGDGAQVKFFLVKRYIGESLNGEHELTRRINIPNNVLFEVDGVDLVDGIDYVLDSTGGSIDLSLGSAPFGAPTRGAAVHAGCSFFVEVRFTLRLDEFLQVSFEDFNSGSVGAPMIEVKVGQEQDHDRMIYDLGFSHSAGTGVVQLEFQQGYFHFITPTAAMNARLPDVIGAVEPPGYSRSAYEGGPYFSVFNLGAFDVTFQENFNGLWTNLLQAPVIAQKQVQKFWLNGSGRWRSW